ncbi:hypothetical protein ACFFU1_05935 [Algibacter miyuki]|uniref:Uncharacterized protein n=1 Tax=Algibacter miyuki TaxID=1306933 RepID=A0ABV5GYX3_9FLAO|nr:hypothetical protein [Algibacter miyuki]MDN3667479.1 hypothetical protein [Algibacter miyuki]
MKNTSITTIKTLIMVCCLSFFSYLDATAQEYGIYELNTSNTQARAATGKATNTNTRQEFYNLSQKLHPTAYLGNNKLNKTYGEGALVKITLEDASSLRVLKQNSLDFSNVELLTITLKNQSELIAPLSISEDGLSNLKYIYIKCAFDCTSEQIKSFTKYISNSGIRVFYTSETAS